MSYGYYWEHQHTVPSYWGRLPDPCNGFYNCFFPKQNSEHMSLNENENLYIGYFTYLK
jgi:hypothetical protein